jgi:hypothetical protein
MNISGCLGCSLFFFSIECSTNAEIYRHSFYRELVISAIVFLNFRAAVT